MEVKWKDSVATTTNGYYLYKQYIYFNTSMGNSVHLDFGEPSTAQKAFDKIWSSKAEKLDLDKELKRVEKVIDYGKI